MSLQNRCETEFYNKVAFVFRQCEQTLETSASSYPIRVPSLQPSPADDADARIDYDMVFLILFPKEFAFVFAQCEQTVAKTFLTHPYTTSAAFTSR